MYYYGQVTGRLEMSITELQQEEGNSLYQVLLSFLILGVFKLYGDTKHKGKKAMYCTIISNFKFVKTQYHYFYLNTLYSSKIKKWKTVFSYLMMSICK